ncbi:uncharacterized protein DS421_16g553140 [Arachis hypogaea]|nr:uncharacterized protein DS421_16g553140 [Arachis hypogaea]
MLSSQSELSATHGHHTSNFDTAREWSAQQNGTKAPMLSSLCVLSFPLMPFPSNFHMGQNSIKIPFELIFSPIEPRPSRPTLPQIQSKQSPHHHSKAQEQARIRIFI